MKQLIVLGFLLIPSAFAFGQTTEDKQTVIQMCIDLEALQPYYHPEKAERKPLVIFNNGLVPTDLKFFKFGEPVRFMRRDELFMANKQVYLEFDKFEITPSRADISFRYTVEGLKIMVTLAKAEGKWVITKSNVNKR